MRRLAILTCLPLCGLAFAACGNTVSTSSFKGEAHEVAQTVANLQADVTAGEQKKVCGSDLALPVVSRLGGTKACEAAVKTQLAEVDSTEVKVESVRVTGTTATAKVKSTYSGKSRPSTINLVKEGGKWKISGLS